MEWQTLSDLTKDCGALSKAAFQERYPSPFLLELNPAEGSMDPERDKANPGLAAVDGSATLEINPAAAKKKEYSPSLDTSRVVHFGDVTKFEAGRIADAELTVHHRTVSKSHARFEAFGTIWSIADLGSTNGTFINGRQLKANQQSPLKFGTKLVLGEAQFLFLSSEGAHELVQSLSKEPRIRPRSLAKYRAEFKRLGDVGAIKGEFPGPFLVVQAPSGRDAAGPSAGVDGNTITLSEEELKKGIDKNVTDAVFDLSKHTLVRIGRASVTQIHLPLRAISTLQAAIVRGEEHWSVQDLGAKNGTYLWGKKLEAQEKLESGAEILLGNIKSMFFHTEEMVTYALHRDSLV